MARTSSFQLGNHSSRYRDAHMNYYPFHIGDYVSATRHLSWEEDAAFRRLLDTYYVTERPIPADHRAACRLVMAQTDSQRAAVLVVLDEFFVLTDEGWINKRADDEILAMRDKQQKQREKANKRWNKPATEPGNASAVDTDAVASKSDAVAMPPTPTPTPTPTPIIEASLFADHNAANAPSTKSKQSPRGSRLGSDWVLPKAWGDWTLREMPGWTSEMVRREGEKFSDFWRSKAGKDAAKLDWQATWRNWCRNAKVSPQATRSTSDDVFDGAIY